MTCCFMYKYCIPFIGITRVLVNSVIIYTLVEEFKNCFALIFYH